MRKSFKLATAVLMAGTMFTCAVAPGFTQNYGTPYSGNYNQTYTPTYSQNYNQGYQQPYVPAYNANSLPPLQGRVVTVPAGSSLAATSTTALSTEFLTTGDTIAVSMGSDFYYNGGVIIPAGSTVEGNVVLAEKAGMAGKHGKLKIRFTNVITPTGQRIPISGKLSTQDGTGLLIGGTGVNRAANVVKNTAVGAGSGAVFGTIIGAIAGGRPGRGAWSGTAVGGGLGLAKSVVDKGKDVIITANSRVDIVLEQPLTVNPPQSYNY